MAVTISGSGQIIKQVVSTIKTNTFATSSTSFVDITGLSVTITPTSASSKILVVFYTFGIASGGGQYFCCALNRNGTIIANNPTGQGGSYTFYDDGNKPHNGAVSYLDSPATTSPITYKIQTKTGGGNLSVNVDQNNQNYGTSGITVMEVSGA